MKTRTFTRLVILFTFISFSAGVNAQSKGDCAWLQSNLSEIPYILEEPVRYRMTADYFNRTIVGHFADKTRVMGDCTIGLPEGRVRWNDCSVEVLSDEKRDFTKGEPFAYMENFSYIPGYQMSDAAAFEGWPENSFHAKNLVWDMLAFDAFGPAYFAQLKLNQYLVPTEINTAIPLAGQGTFENRNSTIRWIGVTEWKDVPCALIEYRQMDGKVETSVPGMDMKGRSHYWGYIWISLETRLVEHAEMTEDVVMNIRFEGQQPQWFNTLREIRVDKLDTL